MLELPNNLALLAKLAARPGIGSRYPLDAVLIVQTDAGYQAVATDGKRLAVVSGDQGDVSLPAALENLPNAKAEALVPASEWCRVLKMARPTAHAVIGEQSTTFEAGGAVLTVAHVEGRFPDVRFLAKQQRSLLRIAVDGRLLGELLRMAAAFAPEGSQQVVLHYQGNGKPLLLTTTPNDQGQRFQGAVMPLT